MSSVVIYRRAGVVASWHKDSAYTVDRPASHGAPSSRTYHATAESARRAAVRHSAAIIKRLVPLAKAAIPLDDREWGSNRQMAAENAFFEACTVAMGDAFADESDFAAWCLKATTEEMVSEAMRLVRDTVDSSRPSWIVETRFTYGFENVWSVDDKPLTFRSRSEAVAELRDHLDDCKAAGMDYRRADFRIRKAD